MKKRIEWLDFAKGITIFFVVFGHGLSTIYDTKNINPLFFVTLESIIFTFIMPCFFAISGYLYKPIHNIYDYKSMIYKKMISLVIPYILFSIIYITVQQFAINNVNRPVGYHNLFTILSTPIAYLWYIYALFFIFVLVGFFDLINVNEYLQLLIYLLCTIISFKFNITWLGLQYTFNNILFFYIGYIISNNVNKRTLNKLMKDKKITILLTLMFILLLTLQSFYVTGTVNNVTDPINIFTKIISILLLFNVSNIVHKNKFYNYFIKYGKFTLIIYLFHPPIMSALRVISFKFIKIDNITSILLFIFLFIIVWNISTLVCYLSRKYNIIYFIFYPFKYIDLLVSKMIK